MTCHEWARRYAERGWPVFPIVGCARRDGMPVCRCRRDDCESPGKHPHRFAPHGFKDATTDRATIDEWWQRDADAAIGVATGHGCDVLDVDHVDFAIGVGLLPDCETDGGPIVQTGSGKWHLYFEPTGVGRRIRFDGAHCDWLGRGGYVIAPPSPHIAGGRYSWHASHELPLTAPPTALLDMLERPRHEHTAPAATTRPRHAMPTGTWSPRGLLERMAAAQPGERNAVLHWCASRVAADARSGRVAACDVRVALDELHATALGVGLGDHEIERTIRSAMNA